jgi:endonuclease/exonuclease/phosphatase family metal-dependent hydrolase
MRLATYNVEWFANLFDDDNRLVMDGGWSGRHDVTRAQQAEALGTVFRAMDADAVMVIEAPDTGRHQRTVIALEGFAARFGLRQRAAVMGFSNDTQQEISLLYDPDCISARHDPQSLGAPRFDGAFEIDLDVDATRDRVQFSKPPLELAVETSSGFRFRMIGAHLKSKAPHGARGHDQIMRVSIANRRKQLAQAIWLRARIEAVRQSGQPLVVMGDLNDGPGLDEYEHLFGRSSVEIVLGDDLHDPHARMALQQRLGAMPASARFVQPGEGRFLSALLDYVMISEDLMAREPRWRIWHPFDDARIYHDSGLREALLLASDHFPITLDIAI